AAQHPSPEPEEYLERPHDALARLVPRLLIPADGARVHAQVIGQRLLRDPRGAHQLIERLVETPREAPACYEVGPHARPLAHVGRASAETATCGQERQELGHVVLNVGHERLRHVVLRRQFVRLEVATEFADLVGVALLADLAELAPADDQLLEADPHPYLCSWQRRRQCSGPPRSRAPGPCDRRLRRPGLLPLRRPAGLVTDLERRARQADASTVWCRHGSCAGWRRPPRATPCLVRLSRPPLIPSKV